MLFGISRLSAASWGLGTRDLTVRWGLLVFLSSVISACSSARLVRPNEPYQGPTPLAVLIEHNPWVRALGSDTPFFALYDDGRVIYLEHARDGTNVYVSTVLSDQQSKALREDLGAMDELVKLKSQYTISLGSLQPTNVIYLSDGKRSHLVTVHGPMWDHRTQRLARVETWRGPDKLPPLVTQLYQKVRAYRHPDATVWVPDYFELVVRPGLFGQLPTDWPAHWPRLEDRLAWNHGELTSVYVPGSEFENAHAYAHRRRNGTPLGLGASVYAFRYVFPNEPMWTDRQQDTVASAEPSGALPPPQTGPTVNSFKPVQPNNWDLSGFLAPVQSTPSEKGVGAND